MKQKTAYFVAILANLMTVAEISAAQQTATMTPVRVAPIGTATPAPTATATPAAAGAQTTAIAPVAMPGRTSKVKAKSTPSKFSKMSGGQCSGDTADALTRGTSGVDVNQVREALRGFNDRVSIGTCNPGQTEFQGILAYKVSARENFAKALVAAYATLKSKSRFTPEEYKAAWNQALANLALGATAESLASKCGILKI
jgi:hypothetical protein